MKPLTAIKGFLVDLDGTTYISGTALPGAVEFFELLKERNIPFLFLSNNPTKTSQEYVEHLRLLGIPASDDSVITSTDATIQYVLAQKITRVYAIGTPIFESALRGAGIDLTSDHPQAVVVSFDLTLTYDKLRTAALLVHHNPQLPYIATNPDRVCPTAEGPIPDCGAVIAFLNAATNRNPLIIGKPNSGMVTLAAARLNLQPSDMAAVGDRLYTDMKMGHDHGMTTILVLSGETKQADVDAATEKPDFVFRGLDELFTALA